MTVRANKLVRWKELGVGVIRDPNFLPSFNIFVKIFSLKQDDSNFEFRISKIQNLVQPLKILVSKQYNYFDIHENKIFEKLLSNIFEW